MRLKDACQDDHVTLQIWKTDDEDEYHVTASSYPLNGKDCARSIYGEYHCASELEEVVASLMKILVGIITEE